MYEAPYVFSSCDQAMRAVNSDVMAPYYEQIKGKGFSILTSLYYGVRDLTCNFLVDSPDDTAGMKIRVPDHTISFLYRKIRLQSECHAYEPERSVSGAAARLL